MRNGQCDAIPTVTSPAAGHFRQLGPESIYAASETRAGTHVWTNRREWFVTWQRRWKVGSEILSGKLKFHVTGFLARMSACRLSGDFPVQLAKTLPDWSAGGLLRCSAARLSCRSLNSTSPTCCVGLHHREDVTRMLRRNGSRGIPALKATRRTVLSKSRRKLNVVKNKIRWTCRQKNGNNVKASFNLSKELLDLLCPALQQIR